jgi:fructose-1,6-bisphosphatase/inositol monophosphatase family enzyme
MVGVMNQPFVGDMFYGNPEGAWADYRGETQVIHARQGVKLTSASVGTTMPDLYREGFERLRSKAQLVRFSGDAYFFALVAAGHIDIALDASLQAYDIAPLLPIVHGAGGVSAEWTGGDAAKGGNVITAGSQELLEEALTVLKG